MSKQYIYEVAEESVDVRKFEIVSDRKLSYDEVQDCLYNCDIVKTGTCAKRDGIQTTYLWTYYGDNPKFEIDGELKEQE